MREQIPLDDAPILRKRIGILIDEVEFTPPEIMQDMWQAAYIIMIETIPIRIIHKKWHVSVWAMFLMVTEDKMQNMLNQRK